MSFTLAGCTLIDNQNIAPGYREAFSSMKTVLFGSEDNLINYDLVSNIPYASLSLKIGNGPKGLMILESINEEKTYWVSADDVFVVIKKGRVIQTSGLINNLTEFNSNHNPFEGLSDNLQSKEMINYYSYENPVLNLLEVKTLVTRIGVESVELITGQKDLILFEEVVENEYLGWKRLNKFWVDDSGFVWKSEQHISPKLPKFVIEITKKPSR